MNILSEKFESELVHYVTEVVEQHIVDVIKAQSLNVRYLSPDEAASYCGVDKQTLNKWVSDGLLKIKVGSRLVKYDKLDLDKFMLKNKI